MTETTIEPTGTYTREQAAKIIATMVLGVKNAESLTCVEAPFDDVPADRWSAGYIAFCVEQGIIDGMTDTTFEPTGTLTGFQWAKMLLAAVGFGANGEFTGTSWSLNTARVAHEAGLFTGDLSGADHVNLSRQQAALYAFNTLTEIKQVSYSANNDNYIYGLAGYEWLNQFGSWWADGTGYTLGWSVFSLKSAEGIIVNNEGVGNDTTDLNDNYTKNSPKYEINADTDAFMLWHGARIWFTASKWDAVEGDAVFVLDLATTNTLECPSESARKELVEDIKASDLKETLTVGDTGRDYYEYALVDNSAVDLPSDTKNYVTVNYKFDKGTLGVRSETKDTTVIDTNGAVDNDNIWTDISEIGRKDTIIYLKADDQYYVYADAVTSGNVLKVSSKGVVTLTDGTVLAPSVFNKDLATNVATIKDVLDDLGEHSTPAYTFYLDTHGHWYSMTNNPFKTVAYYTGAYRPETFEETWNVDVDWIAQFVDVATGKEELVPVTAKWKSDNKVGGYYDITDELYGDSVYAPDKVGPEAYGAYNFANKLTVKSTTDEVNNVIYNPETVVFYIAENNGKDLVVHEFNGNDELLAAYGTETRPVDTVVLKNVCVVTVDAEVGNNKVVTVIFAYDGIAKAVGGTVFLPYGGTTWTYATDHYTAYTDDVYVDGSAATEDDFRVRVDKVDFESLAPGFYRYTTDNDGYVIDMKQLNSIKVSASNDILDGSGDYWKLGGKVVNMDLIKVVDVRKDADEEVDSIEALEEFFGDYADDPNLHPVDICYFVEDGEVTLVYVVDANTVDVSVDWKDAAWENVVLSLSKTTDVNVWDEDENPVTVTLTNSGAWTAGYEFDYYVNGELAGTVEIEAGNDPITIEVEVTTDTEIEIGALRLTVA